MKISSSDIPESSSNSKEDGIQHADKAACKIKSRCQRCGFEKETIYNNEKCPKCGSFLRAIPVLINGEYF